MSRDVISADGVVGWPPRDSGGLSLGVGGAQTDLGRFGGWDGCVDGTVPGKHSDLFLSVKRQRETVAVSCDYGLDVGWREARSTERRV